MSSTRPVIVVLLLIAAATPVCAQRFRSALFPHRSTGDCLWDRSRESCLTPPTTIPLEVDNYNASHGYTGSDAVSMVDLFNEPSPANNWYDWDAIFGGSHPESSTLYNVWLTSYPIFIVKTGYPAGQFMNVPDSMIAYQDQWRRIIGHMRDHPENFFVITTNYPAATDPQGLYRSKQSSLFSDWAKYTLSSGNDSFGPFPPNVYVLDWFHMIARDSDGYCDPIYGSVSEESNTNCPGPGEDHPSNEAVAVIDPQFVQQIFDAAIAYEGNPLAATWAGPPTVSVHTGNRVHVEWRTLSEINTYRFYVQRKGPSWATIDSVNAAGTSLSTLHYAVVDSSAEAGTWTYRIKEVDLNGTTHYSQTVSTILPSATAQGLITAYALDQNYPNPFNGTTIIKFAVVKEGPVSLRVYDILGREVATLVNENRKPGEYTERFDGSRFASGVYLCVLRSSEGRLTTRMIYSK